VRTLVRHLVGQDLRNFLVTVRGGTQDWQAPADELGSGMTRAVVNPIDKIVLVP
jgi:hypothetical protein